MERLKESCVEDVGENASSGDMIAEQECCSDHRTRGNSQVVGIHLRYIHDQTSLSQCSFELRTYLETFLMPTLLQTWESTEACLVACIKPSAPASTTIHKEVPLPTLNFQPFGDSAATCGQSDRMI